MQNGNHSHLHFFIFAEFGKRLPSRFKQSGIHQFWTVQSHCIEAVGQSEHHVKIRDRQQFIFPGFYPILPISSLTFGTVPISATVIADGDIATLITSIYVRSEEHTSELQSRENLVCRLLLEKKN